MKRGRGGSRVRLAAAAVICALGAGPGLAADPQSTDWLYHGGSAVTRYAPLSQITPANVTRLKEAWRFTMPAGGLETQPIKLGDTVYLVTTNRTLVAVDAATGTQKWAFNPPGEGRQPVRGLATWMDRGRLRILFGRENFLYEVDAATGQPVPTFGDGGRIDARANLRGPAEANGIYITSPVSVWRDLVIVTGRVAENSPASPGDVRAFSARTGKLVWTFHTIPHPGEVGAETWPTDAWKTQGGANAWSGSSVDQRRGIVYVNTGSPADDFYGAERLGDNRMANSTIALDARTGRRIWDFQQVHHDLWDSDSTSPPLLTTIRRNGRKVDVAVAWNKAAYVYVFDRVTGKPVFPIVETPVPPSNVPGEVASPTQPIPSLPAPLTRKVITEAQLNRSSPETLALARSEFAKLHNPGIPFTPVGLDQDTLVIPGFSGTWGGLAADPEGTLYATAANGTGLTRIVANAAAVSGPGEDGTAMNFGGAQNGVPRLKYTFNGYRQFRLPNNQSGLDASASTATLNAIDLNTGQYRWTVQLPARATSSGPLVTASKLLFLGGTSKLQAYSTVDGKKLWETTLPAGASNGATTYMENGRQYILIAASGGNQPAYVAFALP